MDGMRTLEEQLARVLARAGFEAGLATAICAGETGLPEQRMLALVATDPVGIQQIVLSSRRMKTRLGASMLLADTWDRRWVGREDVAVVYAGGGQALLLATTDDAPRIVKEATQAFAELMYGRLGVAWVGVSPRGLAEGPRDSAQVPALGIGGNGFGALVSRVGALVRADKDTLGPPATPFSGLRCKECGVRARIVSTGSSGRCERCDAFHSSAREEELDTFDEIGRKLAFLAIDGTEVGRRLQEQRTLGDYAAFSQRLASAFSWSRVLDEFHDRSAPLPVVRGGDDVLLVYEAGVPGTFGVACRVVERIAADLADLGIGVGAGLVVTGHLPARRACALANALVRSAKDDARARGSGTSIDFEVVQSGAGVTEDIELLRQARSIRAAEGPWVGGESSARPMWRPLSLPEAKDLDRAAESAGSDQWSALYRVNERFHGQGLVPTLIGAHYDAARQDAARQKRDAGLAAVLGLDPEQLPSLSEDSGFLLRQRPAGRDAAFRWETAVPDLLDIHRMSREGR